MKREQCAVGTAVFITGGIANGHVGTIESSHGRQYPIVRYGCIAVGVDPADMEEFTIERADEIITALRKRVEALLPFTSHTAGCAIYFRSWAMGEPPCTCGLDATRALGEPK